MSEIGDRPIPERTQPNRALGGYYRSADRKLRGKVLRGVPLQAAEDAVLAALRTADGVINAQIERGMRMAATLRDASGRGGQGDPESDAGVDAGERLFRRLMVAGIALLETAGAEPGSPLRRLLSAEYRLLGAALGLRSEERAAAAPPAPAAAPPRSASAPVLMHAPGTAMRATRVTVWEMAAPLPAGSLGLKFYPAAAGAGKPMEGSLGAGDGGAVLTLKTRGNMAAGRWRAAICDDQGRQLGLIEVEL